MHVEKLLTRRSLIAGAASLGGAVLLGCGNRSEYLSEPQIVGVESNPIDGPATANQVAERLNYPKPPDLVRNWRAGQFITHVSTEEKLHALTFDDGPSPHNTEPILRTLDQYRIKATFYLIGSYARAFPGLVRQIHDAGHQIGCHSEYHDPYIAYDLAQQMSACQESIHSVIGIKPESNRTPQLTIGQEILDMAKNLGMYEVHTSKNTNDWRYPRWSADEIFEEYKAFHTESGIIWLHHDGGDPRPTPEALPHLIEYSQSLGYGFTTVENLIRIGSPQPSSGTYPVNRMQAESFVAPHSFIPCNYDAYTGLESMVESGSLTREQSSGAREVLAEMRQLASNK